jgi:hypothetical protein
MRRHPISVCLCDSHGYPDATCPYCLRLGRELAKARVLEIDLLETVTDFGFGATSVPAISFQEYEQTRELVWPPFVLDDDDSPRRPIVLTAA